MTLRDALRERLRGIEIELQAIDARFRDLNDEGVRAEARLRGVLAEASDVRRRAEAERAELSRVTETEQKLQFDLDQIEQQRANLIGQLLIAQQSVQDRRHALSQLREQTEKLDGVAKRARDASEESRRKGEDLNRERAATEGKRGPAAVAALQEYLASLERKIESAFEAKSRIEEVLHAREALRAARHSDTAVASLLEERDEYRDLLERVSVASVREKLAGEISRIEAAVEAKFPGSLAAEIERPSVMEELYFIERPAGTFLLYLPLSANAWARIGSGDESPRSRQACLFLWHLAAAGLCNGEYAIGMEGGLCVLTTDEPIGDVGIATLSVPVGSGQSVDMLLERVPQGVEAEVLSYEALA